MSKEIARKVYLIPTELGSFTVTNKIIEGFDVEDVIRARAESQGQLIKMVNLGKELDGNPNFPDSVLPTVFKDLDDELEDDD